MKNARLRSKTCRACIALVGLISCASGPTVVAQSLETRTFAASPYATSDAPEQDPLVGTWAYRSLINNPDLSVEIQHAAFCGGHHHARKDEYRSH